MTFFRDGTSFCIKNKLKSEIFNDKKSLSVTTKNLIWEISVEKEGGGGWGVNKKNNCLKRGLGQFADLRGAWSKRGGGIFEGG